MSAAARPRFFRSAAEFRAWLDRRHATATELLVGFHKVGTDEPGMRYQEALDEALCVGWIDGVRRRVDDASYTIRFTPRTARSTWSEVNIARMATLLAEGRVAPAGRAAFERRDEGRSATYSYEARSRPLAEPHASRLRAHAAAAAFHEAQPASYRRAATWWVMSAKREETRVRRLDTLIALAERGERIPMLTSPARRRGEGRRGG